MIESIKNKLFPYFQNFFADKIYQAESNKKEEKFTNFIKAFQNKYIQHNEKDLEFQKKFIKKYASYLFIDNLNHLMSTKNIKKDINSLDISELVDVSDESVKLSSDTVFITHPHTGGNLTGNTPAYQRVVYGSFEHDKSNVKGVYIKDIDVAFIYNGNHSVSVGFIMDDINIYTSQEYLPCTRFSHSFFEANIKYNCIELNNKTIELYDWKIATFFKMV